MKRRMFDLFRVSVLGVALVATAGLAARESAPNQRPIAAPAAKATQCPRPGDPIRIDAVEISDNPMTMGETVSGTVLATCNVAAVTAQIGSYRVGIPKVGVGVFKTTVRVPFVLLPGKFVVVVTAIRTDGFTVSSYLPIEVRW
jgi:hypothetical protein